MAPRARHGLWLLACLLLALVQVPWAGYQLGVGNQSIQVPFLERLHDPNLFPRDEMVNRTLDMYPSFFFRGLSIALAAIPLDLLYLALQFCTAAALFIAVGALARTMFHDHWTGLVGILFLLAGHQQALAEQLLYSTGFTHTWAVFPLTIASLAFLYADRHWAAFAVAGWSFNFHALEGSQLGLALGFWAVCSVRQLGVRKVISLLAIYVLLASPTLLIVLAEPQFFDQTWMQLMRIRSGHHSFPFSWWGPGQPDIPRFLILIALAGLAMTITVADAHRRKTLLLATAVGIMFVAGVLFTEVWPHPSFVRAQLFRSSRFLLVLALLYIARGGVCAWRLPFTMEARPLSRAPAWLEFVSALFSLACLAIPSLVLLLPHALILSLAVALANRRLLWQQAAMAAGAALVCLVAWRSIQFIVPGISPGINLPALFVGPWPSLMGLIALGVAILLWWLAQSGVSGTLALVTMALGAGSGLWLLTIEWPQLLRQPQSDAAWYDVQHWAREHTLENALFLTPAQPDGFRTHSQRSIVGDWRDGTQLFFSADYARPWWERMNALQPGMRLSPDGSRLLVRGRSLGQLDDKQLLAVARQYGATHVVVPADPARKLQVLYTNEMWGVYEPVIAPPPPIAEGDTLARQARFLADVARPNIEKHRKSPARLQVLDAQGRPVYDAPYQIQQTRHAFAFGASLPFFTSPATSERPLDFLPPAVSDAQLDRFRELFNFSVVSQSAWWTHLETVDGQRRYEDLDRYLGWCQTNNVSTEFSFLCGFPPRWLRALPPPDQATRLVSHLDDLLARYGNRVTYWQLTDQAIFLERAANLIQWIREKHPEIKLGLSDAGRFFSSLESPQREADLQRGLADLRGMIEQGYRLDFVSLHGHQPWGLWADPQTVYEVLDAFAETGVKIHITSFAAPSAGAIEGAMRRGSWDPKLQAEYCRVFYTVCFSHPAVEAINYAELGPATRVPGIGLLEADGQPKPAFVALRELLTQRWQTSLKGVLPLDGRVNFRGFHGDYALVVTLPSGKTARTAFSVRPDQPNQYRFQIAPDGEALVALQ